MLARAGRRRETIDEVRRLEDAIDPDGLLNPSKLFSDKAQPS